MSKTINIILSAVILTILIVSITSGVFATTDSGIGGTGGNGAAGGKAFVGNGGSTTHADTGGANGGSSPSSSSPSSSNNPSSSSSTTQAPVTCVPPAVLNTVNNNCVQSVPQTETCFDGSILPIGTCPQQPQVQNTIQCSDGSIIPTTQTCPSVSSSSGSSGSSSSHSSHGSSSHKSSDTNKADSKLFVYTCISGNVTNAINNAIEKSNATNPITTNTTWMNSTINQVAGCIPSLSHGHTVTTISTTKTTPMNIENQLNQARTKITAMSTSINTKNFLAGVMKQARVDGSVGIRDAGSACAGLTNGTLIDQCVKVYNQNYNIACKVGKFGCQS